ncbi:hypothetical protein T06_14052 [Trichinella sp. T6]|nr:hypothetical protein T06_14052 [Trichinella sp. T6]
MSSRRTAYTEYPLILADSIHTFRRCCLILRSCLKAARDITDPHFFKKHCHYNIYLVHFVSTQILHCFRSVLNCASIKADLLHFQTCLELLTSLELQDSCCPLVAVI